MNQRIAALEKEILERRSAEAAQEQRIAELLLGTSKNDAVGVKLDVSRDLPDRGQA